MKKIILLAGLFCGSIGLTQESAPTATSTAEVSLPSERFFDLGLSFTQWNERIQTASGNLNADDKANFKGLNLHFGENYLLGNYGFAWGASLGKGLASGGGNSTQVPYQQGNVTWNSVGAFGRIFWRWTDQLDVGATLPVIYRQLSWPTSSAGLPVDSGKNLNVGLLFSLNFRFSERLYFYQEIGPSGAAGSTLWNLGLAYRL